MKFTFHSCASKGACWVYRVRALYPYIHIYLCICEVILIMAVGIINYYCRLLAEYYFGH